MTETGWALAAVVRRGELVESRHFAAVAVIDPAGGLVASAGDPDLRTVARSAIKPFQAVPLVTAGGVERFGLDDADLALACASHGGRPEHVARVRSLLDRGGLVPDDLACGAHRPMDADAAAALDEAGERPTPLHNNCSGKHAGMLLACRALDLPLEGYVDPAHPLQVRIREELMAACAIADRPGVAIDGCSAPTFGISVRELARGWAALADPAAGHDGDRRAALARLAEAMGRAPEMVAGPGRFTTQLGEVTGGRVLGKEGAEGVYAVAVRGPMPLGLGLKLADGGERARDAVVLSLLVQVGALSGEEQRELAAWARPTIRNHRALAVGEIVAAIELETR